MKDELASVREALDRVIRDRKDQPHVHGDTMVGCLTYADLRDLMAIRSSLSKIEEGMGLVKEQEDHPLDAPTNPT